MTIEEAIRELQNIAAYDIDSQRGKDKYDAIDMAIEALEQVNCEDAVSRQAVINAINQNCIFENEYNLTASRIKKLPSVTSQPKTESEDKE